MPGKEMTSPRPDRPVPRFRRGTVRIDRMQQATVVTVPQWPLRRAALALFVTAAVALTFAGRAHQTINVGDGAYRVVVGLLNAPLYAGQVEGIDLAVFDAADQPVENLAGSLLVTVISPTGGELTLTLRPQGDKPGYYTGDFIPSVPGNYSVRVVGFIGAVSVDELFDHIAHADPAILDPASITVP